MRRASSRQVFNARPDRRTRNPDTADRPSDPPDVPKDFLRGLFRRWSSTDQRTGRTFGDDRLSAAVRLAASLGDPRACRVALLGQYILNPTLSQLEYATMEMVLAGHKDALNMIEVGALEVPEAVVTEGIAFGQKAIIEICGMIEELQKKAGKPKPWTPPPPKDELNAELRKGYGDALRQARQVSGKQDRYSAVNEVYKSAKARYAPEDQSARKPEHDWNTVRACSMKSRAKSSPTWSCGRASVPTGGAKDIRPILCEVGVLPRTRVRLLPARETQSLCVITLGTGRDEPSTA